MKYYKIITGLIIVISSITMVAATPPSKGVSKNIGQPMSDEISNNQISLDRGVTHQSQIKSHAKLSAQHAPHKQAVRGDMVMGDMRYEKIAVQDYRKSKIRARYDQRKAKLSARREKIALKRAERLQRKAQITLEDHIIQDPVIQDPVIQDPVIQDTAQMPPQSLPVSRSVSKTLLRN